MKERGNKLLKAIDRIIGPAIVFALGLFRKLMLPQSSAVGGAVTQVTEGVFFIKTTPRFLLIKTAAIGDTILLSSVIQEIKASQPNSSISLLCAKNNYEAAKLLDNVDEIIVFDFSRPLFSLKQVIKLPRFDYVLDFAQWDKISAIISAFAKADCKVGFYRKNMYRHYAYDKFAEHSDDCHEVDNYRKLCELVGIKCKKFLPRINMALEQQSSQEPKASNHHTNHNLKDWIATPLSEARNDNYDKHYLCSNYQNGYVVFHMFPGGSLQKLKKWSLTNWFELACKIYKEFGYSILVTGAKSDLGEANAFCEMLRQKEIRFFNMADKLSLAETAIVLKNSKMLVSVNTGIMHLASALNVPLVVINGATSVKRWGPLNENSVAISANLDCYPCISLGFESKCDSPKCLESITVDYVFEYVKELELQKPSLRASERGVAIHKGYT